MEEPLPPLRAWLRKPRPLFHVALRKPRQHRTRDAFLARAHELDQEARAATSALGVATVLWKVEGLAFARFRRFPEAIAESLAELPLRLQPMIHSAIGLSAVLLSGFSVPRIRSFLDRVCDRRFVSFAYESLGAVLGFSHPPRMQRLSALLAATRLLPHLPAPAPTPDAFFAQLPPMERRLAAHGSGRVLYLCGISLTSALRGANRFTATDAAACQSGVSAAYGLVNSGDLGRALAVAEQLEDSDLGRAVRDGLVNSLTLLTWSRPGVLDAIRPASSAKARGMLALAIERAAGAAERGAGPPWAWDGPDPGRR
jgi:hypothetical protein